MVWDVGEYDVKLSLQPSVVCLNKLRAAVDAQRLNTAANTSSSSDMLTDSPASDSETVLRPFIQAYKRPTQRLNPGSCKQSEILAVIIM